ncbi:MAG TPA: fructosamine kinase family protein [Polyangia bacterium]|nr:fructosamine kinase family protein [Polyangia bacterium]
MEAGLRGALAAALGSEVADARSLAGGDINQAYEIRLGDGRRLFAKTNPRSPRGMFAAEARGLAWLAEAGALRVPAVVAVSEPGAAAQFLVLELVETGRPARDFDERLGQGLAALHRFGAPAFGLDHDNFVGRLPQSNAPEATWGAFYRTRRLEPQLRQAVDAGLASPRLRQGFQRLFAALDGLVGPAEPPSRLHGDLWGGNLLCDADGAPCLIDPAVYGGHREVDLAMMRLFGGFGARVFAAYEEAWPLADGAAQRIPLYQLYPLMVHVNLFGGGYVGSVEAALARLI